MQSALYFSCKACYAGGAYLKTKIQELRKQNKLSQEELALAVGVTRQTITSLECEKYTASLVLAYKIATFFGMTIEDVFDFSETEEY
jgi:putative transcriptional regulator